MMQFMLQTIVPSSQLFILTQCLVDQRAGSKLKLSSTSSTSSVPCVESTWFDGVDKILFNLKPSDLEFVSWERQIGFLHLLEPVVRVLALSLNPFIEQLAKLIATLIENAQTIRHGE